MGIVRPPSEEPGGWLQWIAVAVPLVWAGAVVVGYAQGATRISGWGVATVAAGALLSVFGALGMLAVWGLIST